MSLNTSLLSEFDHESAGTRRVLERIPDDRLAWRPHAKSWTLAGLATHVANLPLWGTNVLSQEAFDLAPGGAPAPRATEIKSRAEAVATFAANRDALRGALAASGDAALLASWSLKKNGAVLMTLPRVAALRGMVFNHAIHHRGQLSVYLRLLDVPVPGLYGPSADE